MQSRLQNDYVNLVAELTSHVFPSASSGALKLERRMYFLEKKRKSWSQPGRLDPSLSKELEAYQQKAKEMAEVRSLGDALRIAY